MKNERKSASLNLHLLTGLALFAMCMTSCDEDRISPEGDATKKVITTSSFDELEVSDAFSVFVRFSETEESVEIETNPNIHAFVDVDVVSNRLQIEIERGVTLRGSAILNAYITTKNIDFYRASGAVDIQLEDKLVAQDVEIDLSGASTLEGEIETEQLDIDLSGASELAITGVSDKIDASASGASELSDYGFETNELTIRLSGASDAKLTVENEIKVTASGASSLRYKGGAAIIESNLSGASDVEKVD